MATTLAASLHGDRVSGIELRPLCSVEPTASIREAVGCMVAKRTGYALVISTDGKLLGIFTERDFISRIVAPRLSMDLPVTEHMTPNPRTIRRDASVREAIELMESGGYRHVPVLDDAAGNAVGVLSIKEIVHYLVEYFPANIYNLPPTPGERVQPEREGA